MQNVISNKRNSNMKDKINSNYKILVIDDRFRWNMSLVNNARRNYWLFMDNLCFDWDFILGGEYGKQS